MTPVTPLLTPVTLGALDLANRIVMAPMTRNRATPDGIPRPIVADYYAQRAAAGLIVAEMTYPSAQGKAYINTPGIHTRAQMQAWRAVTAAVHARGGRIVLQIGHGGRISHPTMQPDDATPVAPSAIAPQGTIVTTTGPQPFVTPRALERAEIAGIVADFAAAAALARDADFDGIELHGANGYLIDQFLRDGTNHRRDEYGGSPERRARFLSEVVEATLGVWGPGRVGVRLSPLSPFNSMSDTNPAATFTAAAAVLRDRGVAYLHVIEPLGGDDERLTPALGKAFGGPVIVNGGYTAASAVDALTGGEAAAVSFGTPFIANPDFVQRLLSGAPLSSADRTTVYGGDERGYTDYPEYIAAA